MDEADDHDGGVDGDGPLDEAVDDNDGDEDREPKMNQI